MRPSARANGGGSLHSYRAKLALRRAARANELAAARERADAAGSYDAFGNLVLLEAEDHGGDGGDVSDQEGSDAASSSDSD